MSLTMGYIRDFEPSHLRGLRGFYEVCEVPNIVLSSQLKAVDREWGDKTMLGPRRPRIWKGWLEPQCPGTKAKA
jgi:hypothetical protein